MPVTGVAGADRDSKLRQVERITASDVLHGSESLCKLLRYLVEQSIDHPGAGVKEYQIATEVFKRPSNFDPRMDSTVRVQTGRLRSKLSEYYAHAGVEDQWIVEVPKGSYAISFHPKTAPAPAPVAESTIATVSGESIATVIQTQPTYRAWLIAVMTLSGLLAVCVVALVVLFLSRGNGRTQGQPGIAAPLATFWRGFVDDPDEPWVVFSNAAFVGRPETGMHYFNETVDKGQPILDHYTGVGEVLGIHELDRLFGLLHHGLRVKRGRLLSMDDAKSADLIFVGSPSENLSLNEIPTTKDFIFRRVEEGPRKGDLAIVNVQPLAGEPKMYLSTAQLPLTEDYAVVGLMPGLNPSKRVMLLAGLTTLGTQAAVEFVTRANTVEELLKHTGSTTQGLASPFEAVLHVEITGGVPVQSELVAYRLRK